MKRMYSIAESKINKEFNENILLKSDIDPNNKVDFLGYNEKREEPGFNFLPSYLSQHNKNDIETMTILSANYSGKLEMTMKSFKPNLICFSPYLFNLTRIFSLCESIKKEHCETKICIGGSTAAHYSKEIMKDCAAIDYIIIGEGEKKLSDLIDCIIEHKPTDLIPGLVYRNNLSIVETESNENLISLDCFTSISHDLLESVNVKEVMISAFRYFKVKKQLRIFV